jgi:hypothetical protein
MFDISADDMYLEYMTISKLFLGSLFRFTLGVLFSLILIGISTLLLGSQMPSLFYVLTPLVYGLAFSAYYVFQKLIRRRQSKREKILKYGRP